MNSKLKYLAVFYTQNVNTEYNRMFYFLVEVSSMINEKIVINSKD